MEAELRLQKISKSFQGEIVFDNFSLSITFGKTLSILGPSGCGKTTLLRIISGLTKADAGIMLGMDKRTTSYVFQEDRLLPWKNVYNNLQLVLENSMDSGVLDTFIRNTLEILGLAGYESYYPHELSGGMRRRVALARALCYPSALILFDEPFKGLDLPLKNLLIKSVQDLLSKNTRTVILVTHDPEEAVIFGDRIILLSDKPAEIIADYSGNDQGRRQASRYELIDRIKDKLTKRNS